MQEPASGQPRVRCLIVSDLLVLANNETQFQRLDPMVRAEITGLLKLLLDECSAANATEAADE